MSDKKKIVKKVVKEKVKLTKKWEFRCFSGLLKKLVSRVEKLETEIKITIGKDGISTKVVDPAHVALVNLEIPKKDFYTGYSAVNKSVDYKVKDEFDIGIDIGRLDRKFLKLISEYDYVTGYIIGNMLYLDTDDVHSKITLLDTAGMPDPKMPDLEFEVNAKVDSSNLGILMKATGDTSDYLTLIADEKGLYSIIEDDEDNIKIDLTKDVKGKGKALYSCDYFGNIVGGIGSKVNLQFSTDQPIKITGDVYDSGKFEYLLAPRIEGE